MPRAKNTKGGRGTYMLGYKGSTQVQEAVKAISTGVLSIRAAAAHFAVPKSTLADRVSGKIDINAKPGRKPVIPIDVENKIVTHVTGLAESGFGISRKQLLVKSGELCKNAKIDTPFTDGIPGKSWWYGMKHRHPELTIRKPEKLGSMRARMLNREVVGRYFVTLGNLVEKLNLEEQPGRIWNCDETGKQLEHTPVRVIAKKGAKAVVGRTSNSRANISILACVNADGQRMPPMLVVKGKTKKSLYGYNVAEAPPGSVFTYQQNAWMDGTIGLEWFNNVFLKHCGDERPHILILDGHSSHETLEILEAAKENNIHILSLPPHTTHYLQPLDRSVFGPFNKSYNTACSTLLSASPYNQVNKWTFPGLFREAWDSSVTPVNVKSGFRACGIYPFDHTAIPDVAFAPSQAYDTPIPIPSEIPTHPATVASTPGVLVKSVCSVPIPSEIPTHPATVASMPEVLVHSVCPASQHALPDETSRLDTVTTQHVSLASPTGTGNTMETHSDSDPLLSANTVISSSQIDTLPLLEITNDDTQSCELEPDPLNLFDRMICGDITITDENSNPINVWDLGFETIFPSPKMDKKTTETPKQVNAHIKSHRLLTSDDIISQKKQQKDDKERKEHDKLERKRVREEKKDAKTMTKKIKKLKTAPNTKN